MMGLVIIVHVVICALLIIIILIQAGRGTGLVEGFSGVESMFGPKTNVFLTRTTSILSTLFFITCVGLAFLSARQSRSLMSNVKLPEEKATAQSGQPQAAATTQTTQNQTPPEPLQTPPVQTQDADQTK